MKVGTSLSISIENNFNEQSSPRYRSKVIDIKNEELIIDYPIDHDEYLELPIRKDTPLYIESIDQGNVYSFTTKVKRLIQSPISSFAIDIPDKNEIQKIQRREYVRINTDVNIAVHGIDHAFPPFITVTQDISGGGTAIITPKGVDLREGEMVKLYLVLKSKYSDYVYLKTKAEVIRSTTINEVRITSLKFHFTNENDRQLVVKYCFEIQRERLKENML